VSRMARRFLASCTHSHSVRRDAGSSPACIQRGTALSCLRLHSVQQGDVRAAGRRGTALSCLRRMGFDMPRPALSQGLLLASSDASSPAARNKPHNACLRSVATPAAQWSVATPAAQWSVATPAAQYVYPPRIGPCPPRRPRAQGHTSIALARPARPPTRPPGWAGGTGCGPAG
jgi:hypothetical protein